MKILHIINGYCGSTLYRCLIEQLLRLGIVQDIYVPNRSSTTHSRNLIVKKGIYICYSNIISYVERIFFFRKIKKITKDLDKKLNVTSSDIIHAHTLFSDGAVALNLFKKYNIPYVVAVRNTDVNIFFKYFYHCRPKGIEVMRNAKKIIFLSESYKSRVLEKFVPKKFFKEIINKSIVIPNGINEFWISNFYSNTKKIDKEIKLIYVGEFNRNKNIHSIIESIELLKSRGINISFKAIGLGLNDDKKYVEGLKKREKPYIQLLLATKNNSELLKYFRDSNIFIMPSFKETFGLVYAEALTQGLPLIYTKGEGFDKQFYEGQVGFSVNPYSINDISDKILKIVDNYDHFQNEINLDVIKKFDWNEIASVYSKMYKKR